MRTASISLNKILTIIEKTAFGTSVTCENMASFETVISNFGSITLTGMAKPSKLNKYTHILINNGFKNIEVVSNHNAGFDGKNSDIISFILVFTK